MRLIDADAEVKKREKLCEEKNCEYLKYRYQAMCKGCPIYEEIEAFDSAEKVEAEPVRHGRWIEESTNEYYCSYCGKYAPIAKNMRHCGCSKWCKECGARMDGDAGNAESD